jgi:hypothetical protein
MINWHAMKRILLSDLVRAQQANVALRTALRAHFQAVAPVPANLTAILSSVEDGYNSLKNKIDSLEHCERLIRAIEWAGFWDLQNQTPAPDYQFMTIANGLLSINFKAEDALSLLFVTFEHFASCAKNLSDVYAAMLNQLWGLGLSGAAINLRNVIGRVRRRNARHGTVALVDPIVGNDASWWWVASNIRNDSQHQDATSILTTPLGRGATDPPYLDSRLFPRANMLARRLDQFCPWLKDQAFQFVEDMSQALSSAPQL